MCVAPAAVLIPALAKWSTQRMGGVPVGFSFSVAKFGTFSIVPVLAADQVNLAGWALRVQLTLPYGVSGVPYQLDQVNNVKHAGKLVQEATSFFNDKAKRTAVMQAVIDGGQAQHV